MKKISIFLASILFIAFNACVDVDELENDIDALKIRVKKIENEIETIKTNYKKTENSIKNLTDQQNKSKVDYQELKAEFGTLKHNHDVLQSKVTLLKYEKEKIKERLVEFENQNSKNEKEIFSLKEAIKQIESQINDLKSTENNSDYYFFTGDFKNLFESGSKLIFGDIIIFDKKQLEYLKNAEYIAGDLRILGNFDIDLNLPNLKYLSLLIIDQDYDRNVNNIILPQVEYFRIQGDQLEWETTKKIDLRSLFFYVNTRTESSSLVVKASEEIYLNSFKEGCLKIRGNLNTKIELPSQLNKVELEFSQIDLSKTNIKNCVIKSLYLASCRITNDIQIQGVERLSIDNTNVEKLSVKTFSCWLDLRFTNDIKFKEFDVNELYLYIDIYSENQKVVDIDLTTIKNIKFLRCLTISNSYKNGSFNVKGLNEKMIINKLYLSNINPNANIDILNGVTEIIYDELYHQDESEYPSFKISCNYSKENSGNVKIFSNLIKSDLPINFNVVVESEQDKIVDYFPSMKNYFDLPKSIAPYFFNTQYARNDELSDNLKNM